MNTANSSKRSFQQSVLLLLLVFTTAGAACATTGEQAVFDRGMTAFRNKAFNDARQSFETYVQGDSENALAFFYLGLTYNRLHAYADAARILEQARELDPGLPGVQLNLAISYYKQKLYKPALATLQQALEKDPESGEAHFFTGLALQGDGQFDKSISHLNRAMMLDPDYAQMALYYIGRAYFKTGQHQLAQKHLQQSAAIDPTSAIGQAAEELAAGQAGRGSDRRWWLRAEIGYEYNDNLTVAETDTVSDEEDHAAIVEISGGLKLLAQPIEAEITYDLYQSLYSEYSQFNMQSHRGGISASHDFSSWDFSLGYDYTYISLDGDEFMQTQSVMPMVGLSVADLYVNTSYIWQTKDFLNDEDDRRDAQNYSGGMDFYLPSFKMIEMVNVGIRYESEGAEDEELDYTGPVLSGSLRFAVPWGITIRPFYKYQLKQYENMTLDLGEEREDIKQTLGVTMTKKLPYSLKVKGSYKYMDSDSNYSSSDYRENTVFLSLTYSL
ncbi:MAG: tetratricopeptide repeat protein [Candidatus Electrothrix communis]|nr:MAG: tetratricopeptide repeat protein [Candidatus Electrothrix communis]